MGTRVLSVNRMNLPPLSSCAPSKRLRKACPQIANMVSSTDCDAARLNAGGVTAQRQFHQKVVVMRHGDRLDNSSPSWTASATRPWDPPLDDNGRFRAFRIGEKFREQLDFPIHRVFISPFLRCLETAAQAVTVLCAVASSSDDPSALPSNAVALDPSKIKVSIEYGLSEMLNTIAIRETVAPKDWKFTFDISQCEAVLPAGTIDKAVESAYKEVPRSPETVEVARARYIEVIKTLADKHPSENLLLVTHGEGVGSAVSGFIPDVTVYDVAYCGYAVFHRSIVLNENQVVKAMGFFAPKDLFGITFIKESNGPTQNTM